MRFAIKKIFNLSIILFLFFILAVYFLINKFQKDNVQKIKLEPISVNLITSVHPYLSWRFKPIKPKIVMQPGEVITIEYEVENLGDSETTGIATFAYFPNQFGNYISKINCFCYDAKTLKAKEKDKYSLILMIDPQVTKDSKTKNIKEVTMQFIFFDYKKYKQQKS
jgi:cytochrome c oxidase assembly protein subunit 11